MVLTAIENNSNSFLIMQSLRHFGIRHQIGQSVPLFFNKNATTGAKACHFGKIAEFMGQIARHFSKR
jgi:hypothetical protein